MPLGKWPRKDWKQFFQGTFLINSRCSRPKSACLQARLLNSAEVSMQKQNGCAATIKGCPVYYLCRRKWSQNTSGIFLKGDFPIQPYTIAKRERTDRKVLHGRYYLWWVGCGVKKWSLSKKKQLMRHLNNKKPSIVRSICTGWSEKGFGERLLAGNEDKVMTYLNKNFNFLQHSLEPLAQWSLCVPNRFPCDPNWGLRRS